MGVSVHRQIQDAELIDRKAGNNSGKRTFDASASRSTEFAANLYICHGIEYGRLMSYKITIKTKQSENKNKTEISNILSIPGQFKTSLTFIYKFI